MYLRMLFKGPMTAKNFSHLMDENLVEITVVTLKSFANAHKCFKIGYFPSLFCDREPSCPMTHNYVTKEIVDTCVYGIR